MTSVAPMTSVATVAIVRRNQTTTVVSFNQIRKIQLSRVGRGQRTVVCDGLGSLCFGLVEPETGFDKTGK